MSALSDVLPHTLIRSCSNCGGKAFEGSAWGSILAIRTGPADLGQLVVTRMKAFGFSHAEGYAHDMHGNLVLTESEAQFFALAGLPCLPPSQRDSIEARTPLRPTVSAEAIAKFREACQ